MKYFPTTRRQTKQKHNTICVGHSLQTNINYGNKTRALLQRTLGKDEPNIVFIRKSQRTCQHGTQNATTHNRTTQKTKNTDPPKKKRNEGELER